MKTRYGFVSNSSSSSFIIAAKNGLNTKVKIQLEVDLKDYVSETATTIEELVCYFKDRYCDDDLMKNPRYLQAKKAIEVGKTVYFGSFGDQTDSVAERFLCDSGLKGVVKSKDIEIIESEAGY